LFSVYRYYDLRRRVDRVDVGDFIITNRGEKVTKLYEDVSRTTGIQISSAIFRRMVETAGVQHGRLVSDDVAAALSHSSGMAAMHYRMTNKAVAISRQNTIARVDDTEMIIEYIDKK